MARQRTIRWRSLALVVGAVLALGLAGVLVTPRLALERAKDPGLGVRSLHAAGVTGAGVQVAIIDGQLRPEHVEYSDRLVHYEELDDFTGRPFDMHGPAMTSLLVGRSIGVAPQAQLHYFALDFARLTPERLEAAIDRVVARNAALPAAERVRLVSVSIGYRGAERELLDAALERALAAGVFVLASLYPVDHVTPTLAIRSLGGSPWRDCNDPSNFGPTPGEASFWEARGQGVREALEQRAAHDRTNGHVTLYAQANRRTVAGARHARAYRFDVEGGDSQWAPYLIGVLALALQVSPELEADELASLLAAGASERPHGVRLVDPARVVALARGR